MPDAHQPPPQAEDERNFLSCAYDAPAVIDGAISRGLTPAHFTVRFYAEQWKLLVELRTTSGDVSATAVYAHAHGTGRLADAGGIQAITEASATEGGSIGKAESLLAVLLSRAAARKSWVLLQRAIETVQRDGADLSEVSAMAEEVVGVCSLREEKHRKTADIARDAKRHAEDIIAGKPDPRPVILTGMPNFDRWATPIYPHEYVVFAGRSSHGKSSLMAQIAGHNVARGMRVVYFTLETTDTSVIKQIAAQRAQVNLRHLAVEMPDRQQRYIKALEHLEQTKNLLVFDSDLSLDALSSRVRLLAQSYKPNAIFIDYGGLITGVQGSSYERASEVSKSMIPLTKAAGCMVGLGWQLNQAAEKEEREPSRTDFRDSGQVLEDAHRVISVWRKPGQRLDQTIYDCQLLQLKLRDGGTTTVGCKYNAPHTRFFEETSP